MVYCKERRKYLIGWLKRIVLIGLTPPWSRGWAFAQKKHPREEAVMKLPMPTWHGTVSVEQAIKQRRTVRSFASRALTVDQLAQLLGSAGGITETKGYKRAAPSAGALYPMDLYVVVGQNCLPPIEAGVYRYEPGQHQLSEVLKDDLRSSIAMAALSQMWMADAPLIMVITAAYRRATVKYGQRGTRYALIEAGHIGQNIFLQAQALGLEAGIVGAFHDAELIDAMHIPSAHEPILLMPVGYALE
jgi:SagB-type dehydrogenase family enzyme